MARAARDDRVASVVVPTFNRRRGVRATVESVLRDAATAEIVVVVDGSRDGTMEMLLEMAGWDPRVRPIPTENRGEGPARQTGAEAAAHDVLVFLDDDVVAEPGLVEGHLRHHTSSSHLVVLGYMPTELPVPRRPGMFAAALYSRTYEDWCNKWERDPSSILRTLWAGNFSIRRSDALAAGLAAPVPLPYHEDMMFGLRCRARGLTGAFDRSLRARHRPEQRPLGTFVADARRQGAAALEIHRSTSGGPFPFADEEPFPAVVRRTIRWGGGRVLGRVVRPTLRLGIGAAGRSHAYHVEDYLAMVLRAAVQRETIMGMETPSPDDGTAGR